MSLKELLVAILLSPLTCVDYVNGLNIIIVRLSSVSLFPFANKTSPNQPEICIVLKITVLIVH